jgi:hypothetical protein
MPSVRLGPHAMAKADMIRTFKRYNLHAALPMDAR